jgi:hypothetical protein
MRSLQREGVLGGMAEQKNSSRKRRNARGTSASGARGTILPSDLAIPCRVAPLQSPTPFHQAKYSVVRKLDPGARFLLALRIQNRQKRLPGLPWQNRHKRLPGRRRETNELNARPIGILVIIVLHTQQQPTECRSKSAARTVEVQALRDTPINPSTSAVSG